MCDHSGLFVTEKSPSCNETNASKRYVILLYTCFLFVTLIFWLRSWPILNQMNPVYVLTLQLSVTTFNIILPPTLRFYERLSPSGVRMKIFLWIYFSDACYMPQFCCYLSTINPSIRSSCWPFKLHDYPELYLKIHFVLRSKHTSSRL